MASCMRDEVSAPSFKKVDFYCFAFDDNTKQTMFTNPQMYVSKVSKIDGLMKSLANL